MKHKTQIQLRFKDVDKMGHVNNANHFTYLELARVTYFEHVTETKFALSKLSFILAKVSLDYKLPILLEDKVFVYTKVTRFGTKSFDLSHKIVKETPAGEVDLAIAETVLVCFDYTSNKTVAVPQDWKQKIENTIILNY